MRQAFIKKCDTEIKNNTRVKGDWEKWKPNSKELLMELSWHMAKLHSAIVEVDLDEVKEYAADVANICEKAHTMATSIPKSKKNWVYNEYCSFDGYRWPGDKE